jgi:hypothetical protein
MTNDTLSSSMNRQHHKRAVHASKLSRPTIGMATESSHFRRAALRRSRNDCHPRRGVRFSVRHSAAFGTMC